MRGQIAIWVGTAVAIAIYLVMGALLDEQQTRYETCSAVRCA